MKKCPYCAEQVQDEAKACEHCGRDLRWSGRHLLDPGMADVATAAPDAPVHVIVQRPPASSAQILSRLVWGVTLPGIAFAAVDGFFGLASATSAPQQAAAAAAACFYAIVPYTFARGFQALVGGER